ncbi:hypothetical protein B0H19DRAFT_1243285 [Mycena capillaripes]|nr:hypothetical protein B0H19DRAFT_1243285 [Mycena capillaripes]
MSGEGAPGSGKENRPGACHDKNAIESDIVAFCALETRGEGAQDSGEEWGHHDEDVVEGNVPAFCALRTCMRGCAGQWERCGGRWGRCVHGAPSLANAQSCQKKEELTPGTLIIVRLLIFLYTRFLGVGVKGERWSCPTPVDKATIGHCGKTQRMALAADGGWAEGREMDFNYTKKSPKRRVSKIINAENSVERAHENILYINFHQKGGEGVAPIQKRYRHKHDTPEDIKTPRIIVMLKNITICLSAV